MLTGPLPNFVKFGSTFLSFSRSLSFNLQLIVAFGIDSAIHVRLTGFLFHDQASLIGVFSKLGANSTVKCPFFLASPP